MTTIAYVSTADSGDISVLQAGPSDGALRPIQRFATGGKPMPMAVSPDRRHLYVSLRDEPARVLSCSIDAATGELSPLHEAPLPASACHIALDRTGRWLFSASYGGHRIGVNPIDPTGRAQAPVQSMASAPNAHCLRTDTSNRFAFAACLGGGVVMQMRFDAGSGHLSENAVTSLAVRAGAGPRHLEFHPDGTTVYLLNELDATIDTLAMDRDSGCLSLVQTVAALPPGTAGEPWGADLHLTPDGRHLYSCERRSSSLAIFAVDPDDRLLRLLGRVTTETQPRGFSIDASGSSLVIAGQLSNRVTRYAIDPGSGMLESPHSCMVGNNPNWVELVELP